jgi:hypothetical protein
MTALVDVAGRSTKATDQEVPQPHLSVGQIIGRVHRAEDVIAGHPRVKRTNKALEAALANSRVNVVVREIHACQSAAPATGVSGVT